MADLGSIDFRDPQTGGATDTSQITRGVAQLGSAVAEDRKKDILLDFKGKAEVAVDSIEADPLKDLVLPQPIGNPVLDDFRNNMVKLRAAAEQGNSSQKARAELEIKRQLNQAQAKFPNLRTELAQEFGTFARTDAGLDELGLRDINIAAYSKEAAAERKAIVDHGRERWSAGGLGIDPSISPDSIEFARQYTQKRQARTKIEEFNQLAESRSADAGTSAIEREDHWNKSLVGELNALQLSLSGVTEVANAVSQVAKGEILSDPTLLSQVRDWNEAGGKEEALRNIEDQIIQLEAQFQDPTFIPAAMRGTPEWTRIEKVKNDGIAHMDRLITAIRNDDFTAQELWNSEQVIRSSALRADTPNLDRALLFLETAKPLVENWDTLGGEDTILQDTLGQVFQGSVNEFLAKGYLYGGQDNLDPGAGANRIRKELDLNSTQLRKDMTEEEVLKDASANIEQMRNRLSLVNELSSPSTSAQYLRVLGSEVDTMNKYGNPADDQVVNYKKTMGSDGFVEAINVAKTDPAQLSSIQAAGDAAFDFWVDEIGTERHLEPVTDILNSEIDGVPVRSILIADVSNIEKGEIRFNINVDPTRFKDIPSSRPSSASSQARRQEEFKRQRIRRAEEKAAELGRLVTADLRALGNIMYARTPQGAGPNYPQAFTVGDYESVIPVLGLGE